jgi:cobaltochelatase CobN
MKRLFDLLPPHPRTLLALLAMAAALTAVALYLLRESPRVVILSTDFVLEGTFRNLAAAASTQGIRVEHHRVEKLDAAALKKILAGNPLLLTTAPREPDQQAIRQKLAEAGDITLPRSIELLGDDARSNGVEPDLAQQARDYYRHGGKENHRRLFAFLANRIFGDTDVATEAPVPMPDTGIYHPRHDGTPFADFTQYRAWLGGEAAEKPVIGVSIHQSYLASALTAHIDDLVARLEKAGALPVVFYTPMHSPDAVTRLLLENGTPRIDVLVNYQVMYQPGLREQYEKLGVPVLQAIAWRDGDAAAWERDNIGIPMTGIPFYLAIPENAGVTDPLVVSALENGSPVAIPLQMQALVDKSLRLATLHHKPNAEKKIAVFFYNYPAGEKNLSASFLNVPRSLAALTTGMQQAGYTVSPADSDTIRAQASGLLAPFYRDGALDALIAQQQVAFLPLPTYLAWFNTLPPAVQKRVVERWGPPEKDPMLVTRDQGPAFAIPQLALGNLLLLPQPPRSRRGESAEKAIYHNTKTPLHHHYLATYLYVRESFAADALVHFGTHGTEEWTPGKERGLSIHDDPYLVLGSTPVFYPYIVDNIGEATQAKRRGRATIISHQTPAFSPAGLHEKLVPVHDLIHQYQLLDEGAVKAKTREQIIAVTTNDLFKDLNWDAKRAAAEFETFQLQLHDYLHELARQQQPLGLHAFGVSPQADHRMSTTIQMLGSALTEKLPIEDPGELYVEDYRRLQQSEPYRFLKPFLVGDKPVQAITDPALRETVSRGVEWYARLGAEVETASLLAAFDGRYIPTSYGGDPIRNPESLPTGRNLYGFDPSRVPTPAAWEAGKAAADAMIESWRAEHGRYPEKLAFTLWSVETMRHLGVLEAQVLYTMGVKPVWDRGRVTGIEVIPAAELKRPRVDVVVSATGLYRDHFPALMGHIAEAVAQTAKRNEPDNFIRRHTEVMRASLLQQGLSAADAENMALTRVFSSESGAYGTGLDDATQATDSWKQEGKLADLYLNRMQYAYGPDPSRWGGKPEKLNLFAEQLKGVEAAVLSRSSNLYGMLTTDDPFQYLGGLSLAVRHLTGKSPTLHIANLRDPANTKIDSAARFLAVELQTRQFHPGWIEQMQKEGYAGTLDILDAVNNFWGWQVVDPEIVRDDQWQQFHDIYVNDKYRLGMREWFEKSNPHALAQITERMLEAIRKGYWQADEKTQRELVETWQTLDEKFDVQASSSALEPYVEKLAAGFGIGGVAPQAAGAAAAQSVSGQQLTRVDESVTPLPITLLLMALAVLLLAAGGALLQWLEQRRLQHR